MNNQKHHAFWRTSKHHLRTKHLATTCLLLGLAALPFASHAQSTWIGGTDPDWNTAANWSAGVPSGVNAIVNTNAPNIATITNTISATPVDVFVGDGAGQIARVDHRAGDAFTGNGNWMFVGQNGATGTYNLADTATTGGVLTGFGLGSGNLLAGGTGAGGNLFIGRFGGGLGTFNMNSSGTLTVREYLVIGGNGATGAFNLDNGTVTVGRDVEVGGNSTSGAGTMKVSGGTVTADIVTVGRGNNNVSTVTGLLDVAGGTVNSLRWFTLGFAGNSSDIGTVTNHGGTINVNTGGGGNMEMTVWDTSRAAFTLDSGTLNLQNNASLIFGVNGNAGVATFHQNGGTVTFYADGGATVGGAGSLILGNQSGPNPWEISAGTYNYNLNGGTLVVPQIRKTSPNGSGSFNFNGGILKPAAATTTFLEGITAGNLQAGGAIIDTDGYDITIGQPLQGAGALTKNGLGTLTFTGTNTYTGTTLINNGTLALSGSGSLASRVIIPVGRTFDVTGVTGGNVQNPVSGEGAVNGSVVAASSMAIYPGTDGTVGTLTFNNDLDMTAGGSIGLDLSTSHLSGNDQLNVTGNLTVSSATVIHIRALSGAANLSTGGNYILVTPGGTLTVSSAPALAWDGTLPANYLNYSVAQVGNSLVLQYTAATAPTVTATSTPATVVRNQSVAISATVTPGSGVVTNVQVDASQLGGSASAALVLSGTANVYTNTFVVPPALTPGVKLLTVVAKANTGLNSPGFTVTNTVVATNEVWTGAGGNNNWSSSLNWNTAAPAASGDAVTFAGSTRSTPNLDANYSVTGVSFAPAASSFTINSDNGSTLALSAGGGVVNNSANAQTLNVPVTMGAAQTFDAAAGDLILNQSLAKGGNLVTVSGAAHTVFAGAISESGSLFKRGSGSLTLANSSTWDFSQATSGGFSGPLIAQAGTLMLNNGGTHSVYGELVIGGVVANGGPGNDARIIVDGATLNVSSWLSIGRGNGVGGVSSELILSNNAVVTAPNASAGYNGGSGDNKPKGAVRLYNNSSLSVAGAFHVAEAAGGNFSVSVNDSSTLSVGGLLDLAIGFGGTVANLNVNGGTVNCDGDPYIGHWGDGTATLTINTGAFNVGTSVERWMFMGYWDRVNGVININGGAMNLMNNSKLKLARNVNHGGNAFAHVINQASGQVTFYSDSGITPGGSGFIDLQDTGAAAGTSTYNLDGGVLTVPAIISTGTTGTRVFNFNGGTLKAAAAGTLLNLGTGNAHAYVRAHGAIIDDGGQAVTISSALEHLTGEATDGGLTKSGAGTLTLAGANSYRGNTIVSAGTLALAQATLAASSSVVVSNGAVLQLDFATTNRVSALVLNGANQAAGVYNSTTAAPYITGTGSLLVQPIATNPTNLTVYLSGNTLSLSWPEGHLGWILQQQTNSLAVGISTNWEDVAGSENLTGTNITIDPANPAAFYRLRKP